MAAKSAPAACDDLSVDMEHVSELPQRFSSFSMFSLAFTILNSWMGYVTIFATLIALGGFSTASWAPIVAAIPSIIITCGLAELASAFPSSGGPYHYAFMVSPPQFRAPIAFATAWLNILAYLFTIASACLFIIEMMFDLATIHHPEFHYERWQVWIAYAVLLILTTLLVTAAPQVVPMLQVVFFWCSLLALVGISTTLLAASPKKQTASKILAEWTNESGWNDGASFMLALGQCMWLYTCVDTATHVAEEVAQPGKTVPLAMLFTIILGLLSTILFSFAMLFSSSDFDLIATSPMPMYEVFFQATESKAAATLFVISFIVIGCGMLTGIITTAGRLIWAFSRDGGLPYSHIFIKVHPTLKVPFNANLAASTFVILYGLINIGSTIAFNVFVSTAVLGLSICYTLPQVSLLFGARSKILPKRYLNLGRYMGPFCNIFSTGWTILYTVLFCFPLFLPTTAEDMNYVSVVLVACVAFCVSLWYGGKRKTFVGPVIYDTCT